MSSDEMRSWRGSNCAWAPGEIERSIGGVNVRVFFHQRQDSLAAVGGGRHKHQLDTLTWVEVKPLQRRLNIGSSNQPVCSRDRPQVPRGSPWCAPAHETGAISLDLDSLLSRVDRGRPGQDLRRPHRLILW